MLQHEYYSYSLKHTVLILKHRHFYQQRIENKDVPKRQSSWRFTASFVITGFTLC